MLLSDGTREISYADCVSVDISRCFIIAMLPTKYWFLQAVRFFIEVIPSVTQHRRRSLVVLQVLLTNNFLRLLVQVSQTNWLPYPIQEQRQLSYFFFTENNNTVLDFFIRLFPELPRSLLSFYNKFHIPPSPRALSPNNKTILFQKLH